MVWTAVNHDGSPLSLDIDKELDDALEISNVLHVWTNNMQAPLAGNPPRTILKYAIRVADS